MKLKLNIKKFSSTNATTHYELSQYIGTDKPTYLVDYNSDMNKIDTAIYGADAQATLNKNNIGTMTDLTTTDKSSLVGAINEIDSQVSTNTENISTNTSNISTLGNNQGVMANLTTTEKSSLVGAINEVDAVNGTQNTKIGDLTELETTTKTDLVSAINENNVNIKNFNLTNVYEVPANDITMSTATGSITSKSITVAYNSDGSLAKIYGYVSCSISADSPKITFTTPLRPSSTITISSCLIVMSNNVGNCQVGSLTINTNGSCEFRMWKPIPGSATLNGYLIPALYYIKDFGDEPYIPNA